MKPSIRLISGRHITAADKRTILACIDYQRGQDPASWGVEWLRRKASPKSYAIAPVAQVPGRYAVKIRERYRDDYGRECERTINVEIEASGIEPLRLPGVPAPDLFNTPTH